MTVFHTLKHTRKGARTAVSKFFFIYLTYVGSTISNNILLLHPLGEGMPV
jgi:hypothetical protein